MRCWYAYWYCYRLTLGSKKVSAPCFRGSASINFVFSKSAFMTDFGQFKQLSILRCTSTSHWSTGAKWNNLPDFFPFSSFRFRFSRVGAEFVQFFDFGAFFPVRWGTLPPFPRAGYAIVPANSAYSNITLTLYFSHPFVPQWGSVGPYNGTLSRRIFLTGLTMLTDDI